LEPPGIHAIIRAEGGRSESVNRVSYKLLLLAEILIILFFILLLSLPIQDYALREFKESLRNPSAEKVAAARQKQEKEPRVRLVIAAPFALAALLLAIPLFRVHRNRKSQINPTPDFAHKSEHSSEDT
jgi:hypothetical protein